MPILKVARTIADLNSKIDVAPEQFNTARSAGQCGA
jgi:predicted ATPase with chaperone activity